MDSTHRRPRPHHRRVRERVRRARARPQRRAIEHAAGRRQRASRRSRTRSRARRVAVIAEVKRRSPSKGWIRRDDFGGDAGARVRARAAPRRSRFSPSRRISAGSIEDLEGARDRVSIPCSRRTFTSIRSSSFEAQARGASAALLIARALSPDALHRDDAVSRASSSLELLVEVRDEDELMRALELGARDDRHQQPQSRDARDRCRRPPSVCSPLHSAGVVAVAESGVAARDGRRALARRGRRRRARRLGALRVDGSGRGRARAHAGAEESAVRAEIKFCGLTRADGRARSRARWARATSA